MLSRHNTPGIIRCLAAGIAIFSAVVPGFLIWTSPAAGQGDCKATIPELMSDGVAGIPPDDARRWEIAASIWREASTDAKAEVNRLSKKGGLYPAADLYSRTENLFEEAVRRRDFSLTKDLVEFWSIPFSVVTSGRVVALPYAEGATAWHPAYYATAHPMWLGADGVETVLYTAIYLAGATGTLAEVAKLERSKRPDYLTNFSRTVFTLARDHFLRWSVEHPGIWQVRGWGCEAAGLDLVEFTSQRLDGSLGNGAKPYCRAPTDVDMLIAIGILHLLAASNADHEMAPLSEGEARQLTEVVQLLARFMASRLQPGVVTGQEGNALPTVDFDAGVWESHRDMAYAGNEGSAFPQGHPQSKPGVGWDFSHGSRIAHMLVTFAENESILGSQTDWSRAANSFATQVGYRVLDGDPTTPKFRNYLDGSNGWYRIDFAGRAGSGTPPFGLSRAYLYAPWAILSKREKRLKEASLAMWQLLAGASETQCKYFERVFVNGHYFAHGHLVHRPLRGGKNGLELLPFLVTAPTK